MMNLSPIGLSCFMFRMACGWVAASLMLAPAVAEEAASYAEVLNALQSGKAVTVLTDFNHCAYSETGKAGPQVKSGLQIKSFLVTPEKGLVFADVHQTLDKSDQAVTEYIRYQVKADGQMTLNVTHQMAGGAVKQPPVVCQIPIGARFVW